MFINDGKYYLNIFENLPEGGLRFWLQIGFSPSGRDTYIFDPRLKKEVHFSLHRDGNIRLKRLDARGSKIVQPGAQKF